MTRLVTGLRLKELEDLIRRVVREELERLWAEEVVYQGMQEIKRQKEVLRLLATYADWETLPPHLQDAVDNMLAEEAWAEEGPSRPLRELLAETGELPD